MSADRGQPNAPDPDRAVLVFWLPPRWCREHGPQDEWLAVPTGPQWMSRCGVVVGPDARYGHWCLGARRCLRGAAVQAGGMSSAVPYRDLGMVRDDEVAR